MWSVMLNISAQSLGAALALSLITARSPSKGQSVGPTNELIAIFILHQPSMAPTASMTSQVPHIPASLAHPFLSPPQSQPHMPTLCPQMHLPT